MVIHLTARLRESLFPKKNYFVVANSPRIFEFFFPVFVHDNLYFYKNYFIVANGARIFEFCEFSLSRVFRVFAYDINLCFYKNDLIVANRARIFEFGEVVW